MNTNRKSLRYDSSAVGASLSCAARVYPDKLPASFFRFVGKKAKELSPASIRYAFRKMMILNHICDLKVFNSYVAVGVDNVSGKLMRKVFSLVLDLLILLRQKLDSFAPVATTLLAPRHLSVGFTKRSLCFSQIARIFNNLVIAGNGKGSEPNINPDLSARDRQGFSFDNIRKHSVPFATLPLDCDCLDLPFQGTVQLDFDLAHIHNVKLIAMKANPIVISISRESNRIESISAFKSGVARFLARFNSAKVCFESLVQSTKYFCCGAIIQRFIFGICSPYFFKLISLVIEIKRYVILLPSLFAFLKPCIVKSPSHIKQDLEFFCLKLARIQPVKESFTHILRFLFAFLIPIRRFALGTSGGIRVLTSPFVWTAFALMNVNHIIPLPISVSR